MRIRCYCRWYLGVNCTVLTWLALHWWHLPPVPVWDRILGAASPCNSTRRGSGTADRRDSVSYCQIVPVGMALGRGISLLGLERGFLFWAVPRQAGEEHLPSPSSDPGAPGWFSAALCAGFGTGMPRSSRTGSEPAVGSCRRSEGLGSVGSCVRQTRLHIWPGLQGLWLKGVSGRRRRLARKSEGWGGRCHHPLGCKSSEIPALWYGMGERERARGTRKRASPATCCTAGLTQSPSPQTFWGGEKRLDEDRGSSVSLLLDK